MRVLSIGTDESVFDPAAPAHVRQRAYAKELGAVDILVPSARRHAVETDNGLAIYPVIHGFQPVLASLWSRLWIPVAVATALRKRSYDVLTVQDPFEIGFLTVIGMTGTGVPLHVQLHTDPFGAEFKNAHWPLNRIRIILMGFVLRRAARVRVVSECVKQAIDSTYRLAVPVTVLPIYVDMQRFREATVPVDVIDRFKSYRLKILVVSRLASEKNVSLAIEAFARLGQADTSLIVLGDGRERSSLEALAKRLGVDERVFFEGRRDPAPYYALADLVLVPSRYEGYGMTIIEALAAGKPVLSTDVGIAKEAGAIVTTPARFSEALREWYASGPRTSTLRNYPYRDFADYVRLYVADIAACVDGAKTQ